MLSLEYTLTEEEFLNYNFYTGWKDPSKKQKRLKLYATSILTFIIVSALLMFVIDKGTLNTTSITVLIAGIVFFLLFIRFRMRSSAVLRGQNIRQHS